MSVSQSLAFLLLRKGVRQLHGTSTEFSQLVLTPQLL
jgi:hypothetical protein